MATALRGKPTIPGHSLKRRPPPPCRTAAEISYSIRQKGLASSYKKQKAQWVAGASSVLVQHEHHKHRTFLIFFCFPTTLYLALWRDSLESHWHLRIRRHSVVASSSYTRGNTPRGESGYALLALRKEVLISRSFANDGYLVRLKLHCNCYAQACTLFSTLPFFDKCDSADFVFRLSHRHNFPRFCFTALVWILMPSFYHTSRRVIYTLRCKTCQTLRKRKQSDSWIE
jgi:hypothetical protein